MPRMPGQEPSIMQEPDQPKPQTAAEAALLLERTLEHFESVLGALEQRTRSQTAAAARPVESDEAARRRQELLLRLEHALARLSDEAERLSIDAAGLASTAGRLQDRIDRIAATFDRGDVPYRPAAVPEQAVPAARAEPDEPRFAANGNPIGIVLAAVPGFQGLMDVQRALSNMPVADGASVVGYKNGEASLEVVLREPVTAREIVDGLRQSTGHHLLIEEVRPDALRLRLRFVE